MSVGDAQGLFELSVRVAKFLQHHFFAISEFVGIQKLSRTPKMLHGLPARHDSRQIVRNIPRLIDGWPHLGAFSVDPRKKIPQILQVVIRHGRFEIDFLKFFSVFSASFEFWDAL